MADEPTGPILDPEPEEEGGPVKTFLEHLEDLRWVLIKCLVAVMLGVVVCLVASPAITTLLDRPLRLSGVPIKLVPLDPLGPFMISLKIALYAGISLAFPFVLYFIAEFVVPALKKTEKKYFGRAFVVGGGLFVAGVLLCYFVMLRISIVGLWQFSKWMGFETDFWRAESYYHFVLLFMVGMGVVFEIPVVILTLVRMDVISHETLVKGRMYFYVGAMVVCAFITPDALSTFFMVIPVIALMEVCILISKHWERQRRLEEARQAAAMKHLEKRAT